MRSTRISGPAGQKFGSGAHHRVDLMASTGRFTEPDALLKFILASRLDRLLTSRDEASRARAIRAASDALARHVEDGVLAFPMEAHVVAARSPRT